MATYLVSYDLNKAGQDYQSLYDEIKELSTTWCKPVNSLFVIKSSFSAKGVSDRLRKVMDENDSLLVIEVTNNYSGWLTTEIWDHMRDQIFK